MAKVKIGDVRSFENQEFLIIKKITTIGPKTLVWKCVALTDINLSSPNTPFSASKGQTIELNNSFLEKHCKFLKNNPGVTILYGEK